MPWHESSPIPRACPGRGRQGERLCLLPDDLPAACDAVGVFHDAGTRADGMLRELRAHYGDPEAKKARTPLPASPRLDVRRHKGIAQA